MKFFRGKPVTYTDHPACSDLLNPSILTTYRLLWDQVSLLMVALRWQANFPIRHLSIISGKTNLKQSFDNKNDKVKNSQCLDLNRDRGINLYRQKWGHNMNAIWNMISGVPFFFFNPFHQQSLMLASA